MMLFRDLPLQLSPRLIAESDIGLAWARVLDRTSFDPFSGCWRCALSHNRDGYAHLRVGGRMVGAHRVSWFANRGPVPVDRPCVLHRCDVPDCVNPGHLWVGTHADNMRDEAVKNRAGQSRLGLDVVRDIVLSLEPTRALAERLGLHAQTVWRIRSERGDRRRHVRELVLSEVSNGS